MDIIIDGKNFGPWSDEDLQGLADYTGLSLDEVTQIKAGLMAKAKKDAMIKRAVDTRLGSQRKINAITADAAFIALVLASSILDAISSAAGDNAIAELAQDNIKQALGADDADIEAVFEVLARYKEAQIASPVHIKGLAMSLTKVAECADMAYDIMMDLSNVDDARPDSE